MVIARRDLKCHRCIFAIITLLLIAIIAVELLYFSGILRNAMWYVGSSIMIYGLIIMVCKLTKTIRLQLSMIDMLLTTAVLIIIVAPVVCVNCVFNTFNMIALSMWVINVAIGIPLTKFFIRNNQCVSNSKTEHRLI